MDNLCSQLENEWVSYLHKLSSGLLLLHDISPELSFVKLCVYVLQEFSGKCDANELF